MCRRRSSSSHKGSLFHMFQWESELSERLDLGPDLLMGTTPPLWTPSTLGILTILPAGVGQGGPTGSLSPMDWWALAKLSDIGDKGNAILANLMSSSTPVQALTAQLSPPTNLFHVTISGREYRSVLTSALSTRIQDYQPRFGGTGRSRSFGQSLTWPTRWRPT